MKKDYKCDYKRIINGNIWVFHGFGIYADQTQKNIVNAYTIFLTTIYKNRNFDIKDIEQLYRLVPYKNYS